MKIIPNSLVRIRAKKYGPTPKSAYSVIKQARLLLSEEGRWIQKNWFRGSAPIDPEKPICDQGWGACADGALIAVSIGVPTYADGFGVCRIDDNSSYAPGSPQSEALLQARNILDDVAGALGEGGIVALNDDAVTRSEVIEAFRQGEKVARHIQREGKRADARSRNRAFAYVIK